MKLSDAIERYIYINGDGKGCNTPINQVDKSQLVVGVAVELEHGTNMNRAMSIAIDHITENPNYYSILIKSGLVDEPKALALANKYLGIDMTKKSKDEELTNILLGQNTLNKNDYES